MIVPLSVEKNIRILLKGAQAKIFENWKYTGSACDPQKTLTNLQKAGHLPAGMKKSPARASMFF
jgi:hypothetical protein